MPTPYRVHCHGCGDDLVIRNRSMDKDGDVTVEVYPCENCLQEAREEGEE